MTTSSGPHPDPTPATATTPTPDPGTPVPETDAERARLRAELQDLRSDLGDTVAELTERVDVPARVKARTTQLADDTRRLVAEKAPVVTATVRERPVPVAAVAGAAVLFLIAVVVRRRRSSR